VGPIPFKVCNYNCVYCQLGRTTPLTNRRQAFFPPEAILAKMGQILGANPSEPIDYITVSGKVSPCCAPAWAGSSGESKR
jgi:wyosine [tRNA(Phe)-imidazoG37] synthetase (radical SAM superfamily)